MSYADPGDDRVALRIGDPRVVDDLEHPRFPAALRGYDRAAVDEYVDAVGRALRALRVAPETEQSAVRRALERMGNETASVLQQAHEAAEQITARAREDAATVLEESRRRATLLIQDAERHLQDLDADTDVLWQERARIIEDTEALGRQLLEAAGGARQRFPDDERTPEAGMAPVAPRLPAPDDDATQQLPPAR